MGDGLLEDDDDDEDDDAPGGEAAAIMRAATLGGLPLLGIALSVSLDELAMGFSFGVLRVPVAPALVAIALQALVVSLIGQWIGRRVGTALGERAEMAAGGMLCLLGLAIGIGRLAGFSGV